jgi:hypothetical protein
MLLLATFLACSSPDEAPPATAPAPPEPTPPPREIAWTSGLPPLTDAQRVITHLHSPWSHDACDGEPLPDGAPDESCLDDLRDGLCATRVDVAYLTDHPAHAAAQPYDALFHPRDGDQRDGSASVITCADGHTVRWMVGTEDELMPLGLDRHVPGDAAARDALYNASDADAVRAMREAGGHVFVAHTEGREPAELAELADAGLVGIELWNLHAMFDPTKRVEDLGLDGLGWAADIAPFTTDDGTAEPDLFVLAVLERQDPSLARFDELLARGPMVGIVGTDAHQNVLPIDLRDGERGDSYRRMLRWMSNHVVADDAAGVDAALAAGQSAVVFEILGTPEGFRFVAEDGTPMGGTTDAGALIVDCPALHPESPRGLEEPLITARLLRDGQPFAEGCGRFEVGPGVYRVEVDIQPEHLRRFLGDEPELWLHEYPWILSNAIRVTGR